MILETLPKMFGIRFTNMLLLNSNEKFTLFWGGKPMPDWLKDAVFYEIYPQSFMNSNGDGIVIFAVS